MFEVDSETLGLFLNLQEPGQKGRDILYKGLEEIGKEVYYLRTSGERISLNPAIKAAEEAVLKELTIRGRLSSNEAWIIARDGAREQVYRIVLDNRLPNIDSIGQMVLQSAEQNLKGSKGIRFDPKKGCYELVKVNLKETLKSLFKAGFQSIRSQIRSAVQIAKDPNTLRTVAAGGPAALATEAGIVTATGITAAAGGGYLLGIGIRNIPTGKDENGKWKNVGDDWEWLFRNYYWNKHYEQDILSDKVKKDIK